MEIQALFDPKRKKQIKEGLKKGKIPPRARPRLPQPAAPARARTKEELDRANALLFEAARKGDLEGVRTAIANGAKVDDEEYNGVVELTTSGRPLKAASGDGYVKTFYPGRTALIWAAAYGHEKVAELLIENGAKLDKRGGGDTPLIWAAEQGHEKVVELLIEKGADVNEKDNFGRTVLWLVSKKGWAVYTKEHEKIAELLRRHGAKE